MKNSKVLYLLLAFVMCLSLAACGDKQGDDVGGEDYSALAGEWYQDYDGLVFAAEAQPDNYKDSAKRMQLDSIAPEAAIMDIPTLDPHGNLYFTICG